MAWILSIGVLQPALRIRNEPLRRVGFEVSWCTSIETAKWLFKHDPYDLVIIGHGIRRERRVALAWFLRKDFSKAKIIYLYRQSLDAAELADAIISAEESAENLVSAVHQLISQEPAVATKPQQTRREPFGPTILCVCAAETVANLRQVLLSSERYEVLRAMTLAEVEAICRSKKIVVTIFGSATGPRIKAAVQDILSTCGSSPHIIEIGLAKPFLPRGVAIGDSSKELIQAVRAVFGSKDISD